MADAEGHPPAPTSSVGAIPIEWRCKACRFEQWVRVTAKGRPSVLLRGHDTFTDAEREASARVNAWRNARMKLAMRPCPRCGAIDRAALVKGVVWTFSGATLATAVIIAVALIQGLLLFTGAWPLLAAPVVGFAFSAFMWLVVWPAGGREIVPMENEVRR